MGLVDYLISFGKAVGSSIAEETHATLANISGIASPFGADDELVEKQPIFPGIGPVWRHLPPEKLDGRNVHAEVTCLRTGDGLVPIAWRDLRIFRAFPSGLAPGQVAFAGYGKGFYSLTLTTENSGSEKANIHVLYCPYEFDADGVPAKAHVITLDPEQEAIMMVHGDGYAVVLDKDNGITLRGDSSTWLNMKAGKCEVVASSITLRGNVALGANTIAAVPLLPGAASQPTPSVFFSPV